MRNPVARSALSCTIVSPEELRDHPEVKMLAAEADEKVCNIVHLIYNAKSYEGIAKDYEFSCRTMEEHWTAATRMSSGLFPTLKSCNVPASWKVFAPSTGLTTDRNSMAAVFFFGQRHAEVMKKDGVRQRIHHTADKPRVLHPRLACAVEARGSLISASPRLSSSEFDPN
jgi:hypothetical protein